MRLGFPIRMEPAEAQERLAMAVRAADPGARSSSAAFAPVATPSIRRARSSACSATAMRKCAAGGPARIPSRATTDLRFFEGQAVCYGPTGESLHGVDEWVDLESIADVAAVIALAHSGAGEKS